MELSCKEVARASAIRPLISRMTILILAAVLIAMGLGAHLPTNRATTCLVWGSYGLLAYGVLEVTAKYRMWRKFFETRKRSGRKLDQWISTDLTFRCQAPDRPGNSSARKSSEPQIPGARYLLVVDDDPETAQLIRTMLKPLRIRVLSCSQPDEAVELSRNAAAILCNLQLGSFAGTDIVRDVRRRGYHRPIIMMSGESTRSTIDASIQAGIDDFLVKPFSVEALVHRLRRLMLELAATEPLATRELSA